MQILSKGDEKKHKMTTKSGKSISLLIVIIIVGPATDWTEIRTVPSAQAELVSNEVELTWLTRYPLPSKVIVDRGKKFLAKFREIKMTTA